ncbi:MAG TPA: DUF6314 family protein [Chlamydiales bacterium]|nr:DUF6314 family protein [Chlamydiales bacterium]
MLGALLGSQNAQKALLSLFVNRKCYASQLKRSLDISLTPLQKAFARLEKANIITSYLEGKTKLYQLNPTYPLLEELELLLKKAFMLLPIHEQKRYYLTHESGQLDFNSTQTLMMFWNKLCTIKHLIVQANTQYQQKKSKSEGKGVVTTSQDGCNTLIFKEKGLWKTDQNTSIDFHNTYRWTLDRNSGVLSLEHLRLGLSDPVFLFHLAPASPTALTSVDSHSCGDDTYYGQLFYESHFLRLHWRIIGPHKNEDIHYYYT